MDFKKLGLPLAIVVAAIIMLIPLEGLSTSGHLAIALLVFAIIMWVSEALHLAVTSLIILFIQPILGIAPFSDVVVGFSHPIIFLMIGGFIIAEGIRKSGLVERFTYFLLDKVGTTSSRGLFVSVFSVGIISPWIENVVAFALVIPIIKEIVELMGCKKTTHAESNFAKSMILGAAIASLIGGLATQIGTAPNLMATAYTHMPFANWMIFGYPLAIVLMLITWKYLGWLFPSEVKEIEGGKETINRRRNALGKVTRNEKTALVILLFTISLWVTASMTGIDSFSVALIGASLFFVFKILDWKDAQKNVDWGLILFFGGALSIGASLLNTGAAEWLVRDLLSFFGPNPSVVVILLLLMLTALFLTQITSNIVVAAVMIPLSVTLAQSQFISIGTYAVPIAIAASMSFMLPMSDPTLAMAYGSGFVKLKDMIKAGAPLVVIGGILSIVVVFTIGQYIF